MRIEISKNQESILHENATGIRSDGCDIYVSENETEIPYKKCEIEFTATESVTPDIPKADVS